MTHPHPLTPFTKEQAPAAKAVLAWLEATRTLGDRLDETDLPLDTLELLVNSARAFSAQVTWQFLSAGGEMPGTDDE